MGFTYKECDCGTAFIGYARPMIVKWRAIKATHPNDGNGLDSLRTEGRFTALELR